MTNYIWNTGTNIINKSLFMGSLHQHEGEMYNSLWEYCNCSKHFYLFHYAS